jgi:Protein of unknown function (DUF3631)
MLLVDIRSIFERREHRGARVNGIHSVDLVSALCELEGRPWAEGANGQRLNPNRLAKQLKKYRIYPQSTRLNGLNQKGYLRHSFNDAWTRYCPPTAANGSSDGTPVTASMELAPEISGACFS